MDKGPEAIESVVTIVMPTFNRAGYIAEAIDSVLGQTFRSWKLLIVDDGSTDGTRAVVEPYLRRDTRIGYVFQAENRGIAFTRNHGVALAKSPYIAMLDSDDAWASAEKLGLQIAALEADPGLGIIGTWFELIDEKGEATGIKRSFPEDDEGIRAKEIYRNAFAQSSVVFRKAAFDEAGGYDGHFVVNDDHDLWLKIGRSYRFTTLPRYDLRYRRHPGNITVTRRRTMAREGLEIVMRHRAQYPGALVGGLKGLGRLGLAFIGR